MDQYILSRNTQDDINELNDFGVEKFGEDQALEYLIGLRSYFELLMKNPHIGKKRIEIKKGLFSLPYGSHIIFYRIFNKHLRIVRVLHGSRYVVKFLK